MPLWLKWTLRTLFAVILVAACVLLSFMGYGSWSHTVVHGSLVTRGSGRS